MINVEACSVHSSENDFCLKPDPILDDGALYSGIGEQYFHSLRSELNTNSNGSFYDRPVEIPHHTY